MEGVEFDKKILEILNKYNQTLQSVIEQIEFLTKNQSHTKRTTGKALENIVRQIEILSDRCSCLEDTVGEMYQKRKTTKEMDGKRQ